MRINFFIFFILSNILTYSQSALDPNKTANTKQELEKLWINMQDASVKKDRKSLESFYADEFLFIHSSGQEDNKQRRIDAILSVNDYKPAPMPSFEELYVYGDVAILRAKAANRGTTIFAKKNGSWQVVQVQSTALPPARNTVKLDPKAFQQYVGTYERAPGVFTLISYENDTLRGKGANRPQVAILPISDNIFAVKDNVGEFTFYKDDKGQVTHYILRVSGREIKGNKVE